MNSTKQQPKIIPEMLFTSAQGFHEVGYRYAYLVGKDEKLLQRMAPAMTNFSFCIELLLKGLLLKPNRQTVGGHSMVKLYSQLSSSDKIYIEHFYDEYRMKISPDSLGAYTFGISKKSDEKVETKAQEDLSTFLKLHDDSFINWRYFFEYGDTSKKLYANFHLLDSFARALVSLANLRGFKPVMVTNYPIK